MPHGRALPGEDCSTGPLSAAIARFYGEAYGHDLTRREMFFLAPGRVAR